MNVQEFLRHRDVPYEVIAHDATFDAQRMSHAVHESGHHVAKTVLLRSPEDDFIVAVLPASDSVDFVRAGKALGISHTELASESQLSQHCADCEVGALPPFGSQYNMQTVIDQRLTEDPEIVFEGNNHNETIKMKYADYARLEDPLVASICVRSEVT